MLAKGTHYSLTTRVKRFAVQKFLLISKAFEENADRLHFFDDDIPFHESGLDGAVQLQHTNRPLKICLCFDASQYV